jgi:hypothetical protein
VKENFARTNKRDDFQVQIIRHTMRQINASAKHEAILQQHTHNANTDNIDRQLDPKTARPSRALDLVALGWKPFSDTGAKDKIKASHLAAYVQIDGLLDALAVFVREMRKKGDGKITPGHLVNRREDDATWISDYMVQVHPSMTCWKSDGKDPRDVCKLTEDLVRCSPNWQGKKGEWRHDYVWIQELEKESARSKRSILNGKRVGQLQLIVSIRDHERRNSCRNEPAIYTGTLVEIFQPLRGGLPHEIHGMVEVQRYRGMAPVEKRNLGSQRFYAMENILRSAHLIPASSDSDVKNKNREVFFINNYIDWEQYNTLYDSDFKKTGKRLADNWYKKLKKL